MKSVRVALLLWAGSACVVAAGPLPRLVRTVQIPRDFTNQAFPRFSNGFVLAYDFDRAIVRSYDRTGRALMEVPLSIPDGAGIRVRDTAALPDGTIAVKASATADRGRAVGVIFWISPQGKVMRIVRTAQFGARRVAFAADGTLWAAGRVYDYAYNSLPEYDVLRQYDAQGRLVRTVLPRSTFAAGLREPSSDSFLLTAKDRIGFFSLTSNQYVELSLSGDVLGNWKVAPPADVDIAGAALTASGRVFLSGQWRRKMDDPREWELLLYELDKRSGALRRIDFPQTGVHRATVLVGSEGEELVFESKPPASISWFALQ